MNPSPEDVEWEMLERRLKKTEEEKQTQALTRASIAAAEFIASQSAELLAITTLRKAFEYGHRTGWRDAKGEDNVSTTK